MAAPRAVYRIEQFLPAGSAAASAQENESLRTEIAALVEAIARTKREIATVHVEGIGTPAMARLADQLAAVVTGTEQATQRILHATETIARAATALAAVGDESVTTPARDILTQVTRLFEACNFQDLAGQRIATVTTTLTFIEDHLIRMTEIWGGPAQFAAVTPSALFQNETDGLVNGPRLDSDSGHASQSDIDALFADDPPRRNAVA